MNQRIVNALDSDETKMASDIVKKIQLIDTLYMLKDAWRKVTSETISNCYAKAGWKTTSTESDETPAATVPTPANLTDD